MVTIGKYNRMKIVKEVDFGLYLDGEEKGEILLPRRYMPDTFDIGDDLDVFVYLDADERLIATTQKPYAQIGDFAFLKVNWVNQYGAFLDWGLMKDLFVPFREQKMKMEEGKSYLVYLYWDELSERIVASAKIEKYIDNEDIDYTLNEEVDLLIAQQTDLGYKAIINNRHWGMLYHNQVFKPLSKGDRIKGYIKEIRSDLKIDLLLEPMGYKKIEPLADQILKELSKTGGTLPLSDKSSSDLIMQYFGCSKKNFKKAIGALYKEHKIVIHPDGICLN
ncbi:MAG: S1-like domain-containing RNA-binding protein [Bacteroidales bacterium]|nr:S1-like domain-containing RNA-binding protein [Bacteroidales bacterium]